MTDQTVAQWNALQAQQRKNWRLRDIAVARNLPGIRELVERRMARVVAEQEALFK